MKKHLLFLFAALLPLVTNAYDFKVNNIYYNITSKTEKKVEVTYEGYQYNSYSGSITLPATVTHNGVTYSVTSIGSYAFCICRSLTAITIPASVTSIGGAAFYGCSSLTAITIPEGVTSIGADAFSGCSKLKSITIPENSQLTSIEIRAFLDCSSLTAITIPEGVTSIAFSAFSGCSGLTAIAIPEGVTSIGNYAFWGCTSLTDITIPKGVTSIGSCAFQNCSSLTAITIPKGVTSIGSCAFQNCSSLTAIIVEEGNEVYDSRNGCNAIIETASNTLISGCSTTIIPESVTSIGVYAFSGRSSLTAITIPEGVTSIGEWAFSGCSSLTSIVLPKSLKNIGSEAFANCPELLDVYCYAEEVPSTSTDAFDGSYPEYITLHVPANALENYKNTYPWKNFGKFEIIKVIVDNITLSQSTATLYKGDELMLTATITPDDATDKSISWSSSNPSIATIDNTGKVTAVSVGTATITAMANDGSKVSASCEVTIRLRTCAMPTISYIDGEIVLTCSTEGAEIKTNVTTENDNEFTGTRFEFIPTHTFTAYATKENYEDSDVATLTLCWVPCDENHEGGTTDIITIPAKPVLISTQGGTITVSGLADGTEVTVYSTAGPLLATAESTDGTATLNTDLTAGNIAVVKIGEHSIKVAIK